MRQILILIFSLMLFLQPALVQGTQVVSIQAAWQYTPPADKKLSGFRLYKDGQRVREISNPSARSINCQVEVKPRKLSFTITAYFSDGIESPHSAPFFLDLSRDINMVPILNLLLLDG